MKLIRFIKQIYTKRLIKIDINSLAITELNKLKLGAVWSKKDRTNSLLLARENSSVIVLKKFRIYSGAKIYVNKNAQLLLGSVYINHNCNISCFQKIEIGYDVAI